LILTLALAACASGNPTPIATPEGSASAALAAGSILTEIASEPLGQDNIETLSFSPDGQRLALGAADGFVAIYQLQSGRAEPLAQKLHTSFVTGLAWSPDGSQILTAATDGSVRQSDSKTLQVIHSYTAYPQTYPAVAWSPDGSQFALAQGRDTIQVVDAGDGSLADTFDLPGSTRALWWLPSGEIIGSTNAGQVSFFTHGQRKAVRSFQPNPAHKAVNSLAVQPGSGLLAAGYDDGTIVLIDPTTAKQVRELAKGRQIGTISWSPNGQLLAASSVAFDLRLLDLQGSVVAHEDIGYDVNGTAWSPDGKLLAASTDAHDFRLWQVNPAQTSAKPAPAAPSYMGR